MKDFHSDELLFYMGRRLKYPQVLLFSILYFYIMLHGLPDVTLQSPQDEVILKGVREVTSERQVILHDPSVTSMVLIVQNGRNCIAYIYNIIKQWLPYVSVDIEYH